MPPGENGVLISPTITWPCWGVESVSARRPPYARTVCKTHGAEVLLLPRGIVTIHFCETESAQCIFPGVTFSVAPTLLPATWHLLQLTSLVRLCEGQDSITRCLTAMGTTIFISASRWTPISAPWHAAQVTSAWTFFIALSAWQFTHCVLLPVCFCLISVFQWQVPQLVLIWQRQGVREYHCRGGLILFHLLSTMNGLIFDPSTGLEPFEP